MKRVLVAGATCVALLGAATPHSSAAGTTMFGMFPGHGNNTEDRQLLDVSAAWLGKRNAISNTYAGLGLGAELSAGVLDDIWAKGSVPMVSYGILESNSAIAMGQADAHYDAVANIIKSFVKGSDGVYGSPDDRRVYFRPAWESNGGWMAWSPCSAGTNADFIGMWRRIHDRLAAISLNSNHVAWVYSVDTIDAPGNPCRPELTYPGDAYVDWLGIDGYSKNGVIQPADLLTPMANRLRAIAPTKPLGINETGVGAAVQGGKNAWIANYFSWLHANDVRMSVWFNTDKEQDWAVIGGGNGDAVFNYGLFGAYNVWSAYKTGVQNAWVTGSNTSNPRLLSDAQFLGQ